MYGQSNKLKWISLGVPALMIAHCAVVALIILAHSDFRYVEAHAPFLLATLVPCCLVALGITLAAFFAKRPIKKGLITGNLIVTWFLCFWTYVVLMLAFMETSFAGFEVGVFVVSVAVVCGSATALFFFERRNLRRRDANIEDLWHVS